MTTRTTMQTPVNKEDTTWGSLSPDHYGYSSDSERLEKRGLEDWEMVENLPTTGKRVPRWFIAGVVVICLVAAGLSLPFWGDRPGYERPWLTMGHLFALFYVLGAFVLIYFMTRLYGSGKKGDGHAEAEDDVDMPSHSDRPGKRNTTSDTAR